MKKELLNELDTMKYLFDYKAGKVISEQISQNPSGNNIKEFANILLDAIQSGKNFLRTEFTPGKIIIIPNLNYNPNTGSGTISFTEYIPGEKTTKPTVKEIQFSAPKDLKDNSDLFSNREEISFYTIKNVPSLMSDFDLAELMFVSEGDKNPQEFYNFLLQIDSKLIDVLKKSMEDHLSRVTYEKIIPDKDVLRNIYNTLFVKKTK